MFNSIRMTVSATVISTLAASFPTLVLAQPVPPVLYTVILPAGEFGSQNFTKFLSNGLASAHKFCSQLDQAYQADCLAERIEGVADQIPKDSDYADAQAALKSASDKINALARANRDTSLPRGNASVGGTQATSRPLTPVATTSLASVNSQAAAILQETETLLLRSASTSQSKQIHYQRIADALGSNKVLLRST